MAKKSNLQSPTSNVQSPTFHGAYVNDIREACIASALAGQHIVILGAPGYGKTAIARALAEQIAPSTWKAFQMQYGARLLYVPVASGYGSVEKLADRVIPLNELDAERGEGLTRDVANWLI